MSFNPYAAPQAPGMAPAGGPAPAGAPQPWEVGEVIGHGWEIVKKHWPVLVFAPFVAGLIQQIPSQIFQQIGAQALQSGSGDSAQAIFIIMMVLGTLISLAIQAFFQVGLIRINLAAARGQEPSFGDLWGGMSRFFPLLGTMFLFGLAVLCGYILLIVPGIILALGLSLSQYYCVDAEMGPIEALKASWEATTGHKGSLFLFGLAAVGVVLVGMLACCIGVLPASAVIQVAMATVYCRLSGRGGAGGGFGGAGMAPPPGAPPQAGFGGAPGAGFGGAPGAGFGGPGAAGFGGAPPAGGAPGGGFGAPPAGGGAPPAGGGFGGPPGGGAPPAGGGFGGPPAGGGGAPPGGGWGTPGA